MQKTAKGSTSLHDGENPGAVRRVRKTELVVYRECGDFEIPLSAVKDAEAEKVILIAPADPKLKPSPGPFRRRSAHSIKRTIWER